MPQIRLVRSCLTGMVLALACFEAHLANAADPGEALKTPLALEQIDPATFSQWVAGEESALDVSQRDQSPEWIVWTTTRNKRPGHSGLTFGAGKMPGPRHLRIGFTESIPVGSVLVRGGGSLSVLKPDADYPGDLSDDSQWISAVNLKSAQLGQTEAAKDDFALWIPPGTRTRALRFTHVAAPADNSYEGWIGGVVVLRERLANVAPFATAAAESNHRYANRLINGHSDSWNTWENLEVAQAATATRGEISSESPEWVMLVWPEPVKLDRLLALWAGFGSAEVQAYGGPTSRHPRDAFESDWQSVGKYDGLENGYPCQLWPNLLLFDQPVTARAVRVKMTAVTVPRHPHVMNRTGGGKRVWLGELMACRDLGSESPQDLEVLNIAGENSAGPHPPIAVPFHLPEAGYVTLVIEDADGKRVRNLVSETPFPAGDNIAWWDGTDDLGRDVEAADHGLYSIPARLVAPGQYRARGLWRKAIEKFYEFPVYSSGSPPWSTPDHTGAWLANHSPPSAAVFVPASHSPTGQPSVFLGSYVTEGPDGFAWVDLDGTKRGGMKWIGGNWTAAPFLGRDTSPQASPDAAAYVASAWETEKGSNQAELRVTALMRKGERLEPRTVVVHKLRAIERGEKFDLLGGVAAYDNVVVCCLKEDNKLLWIDAVGGMVLGTAEWESPRGVVFDTAGRLYVLTGQKLLRLAAGSQADKLPTPETLINSGLEDPHGITLDAAGNIYISDHGQSHQVKVFDAAGKFLRSIGRAGVPEAGVYDPQHMNHPLGLAVDSLGQLWVAEHDYLPKRVSVWSPEGKLVRAFYGPGKYGGGGTLDSHDRSLFYYADESRGAMEFRLDWERGTSQLARVIYRNTGDFELPFRAAAPETPLYAGGRRYFTNCYNTNPTSGHGTAFLYQDRDGVAQPVAAMGLANYWPLLKTEPFQDRWPAGADPEGDLHKNGGANQAFFIWCDANADAQVQPSEVQMQHTPASGVTVMNDLSFCIASLGGKAVRFQPVRFDAAGIPRYELEKCDILAEGVLRPASSGGNQLLADDSDEAVITLGVAPYDSHSLTGIKDSTPDWCYPSPWPGLHASHKAAQPNAPGQVIGSTRLLGGFFDPPGSKVGPLWAINGNMGNFYIFTRDGLFVATVFEDVRQGNLWKMPIAQRGMSLAGITLHDENFWPSITCSSDGKVYAVDGSYSSLVRLEGLETLRPIPEQTIEVTPQDLAAAHEFVIAQEAERQKSFGSGILKAAISKTDTIQIDGNSHDWDSADWVEIDKRGVKANFNANSKPFDVLGAVSADSERLYAAWKTAQPDLLKNSGEVPMALFKTGGALDLMLGTNPQAAADRRAPVAEDLRLLVTQVAGKTRALIYRPVALQHAGQKVPFSSPWRTITFDQVQDVSEQVQLASNKDGFFEIAIPLSVLGLKPQAGTTIKGDIGILRGTGSETTSRSYWSNKATGITADVPSEAELSPHLWGTIEWQIAGSDK